MANARGPIRTGDPAGATTWAFTSSAAVQSAVVTAPQQTQVLHSSWYSVITGAAPVAGPPPAGARTPSPGHRSTTGCTPSSAPVRSGRPDPGCPTTTGTRRDPRAACQVCDRTVPAMTAASRVSCSTVDRRTAAGRSSTNPHRVCVPARRPGPSTARSIRPAQRPTLEARPPSNRSQINCAAPPFHDHVDAPTYPHELPGASIGATRELDRPDTAPAYCTFRVLRQAEYVWVSRYSGV